MKNLILFLLVTITLIGSPIKIGIEKGNTAPKFSLYTKILEEKNLEYLEGKKYIIKFFTTWCPKCEDERESLEEFVEKYKEKIEVIYVSVDSSHKVLDKYIKNRSPKLEVLYDKGGRMSRSFLVRSIPQTYVVDEHGIIVDKWVGKVDWSTITMENLYGN